MGRLVVLLQPLKRDRHAVLAKFVAKSDRAIAGVAELVFACSQSNPVVVRAVDDGRYLPVSIQQMGNMVGEEVGFTALIGFRAGLFADMALC